MNPATGAGYYCRDFAGRAFESSGVQVYAAGVWTAANTSNSSPTHRTPPPGSSYDCPGLTFTLTHPNDHWIAQIGATGTRM